MGYQVGNQCFSDKKSAENHYFSQIIPTITADGKLYQPTYTKAQGWQYEGKSIQISLPECSPEQNFKDGLEVGSLFLVIAVVLWATSNIGKLLDRLTS